jgi:hypothetical protein
MKKLLFSLTCSFFMSFIFVSSAVAITPVFLSPMRGMDNNPCTLAKPCRQFAAALSAVSAGGEIVVLDSGAFVPFTINKSVSINASANVYAGIVTASQDAITINAGSNDIVTLRGLTLKRVSAGQFNGVVIISAADVHVENCMLDGLGISFLAGKGYVKDSFIRNYRAGTGINVANSIVEIDNVRLETNNNGLFVFSNGKATVRNSTLSGNEIGSYTSVDGETNIENCLIANNSEIGVVSDGGPSGAAIVRLSGSAVTDNDIGLSALNTSQLLSRGNNTVEGNNTDTSGTIGSFAPK